MSQQSRTLNFAGSCLKLEYSDDKPARVVDFLYRDVNPNGNTPPHLTYKIHLDTDDPTQLCAQREDKQIYRGDSPAILADRLLGDTCHNLADKSVGGLLFHAAALDYKGNGLIMPGTMGAGKTTLTAWLLTKGFNYLSDELVFIANGENTVEAFPRPLNLKRPSREVLQEYLDFSEKNAQILVSRHTDLVSPLLLNPGSKTSQPPLRLIVFPRYTANSEFVLQQLSKAQAGKALMQCLVNAQNLPDLGFSEITRLARQIPAYKLQYSNFAQLDNAIEQLLHK